MSRHALCPRVSLPMGSVYHQRLSRTQRRSEYECDSMHVRIGRPSSSCTRWIRYKLYSTIPTCENRLIVHLSTSLGYS